MRFVAIKTSHVPTCGSLKHDIISTKLIIATIYSEINTITGKGSKILSKKIFSSQSKQHKGQAIEWIQSYKLGKQTTHAIYKYTGPFAPSYSFYLCRVQYYLIKHDLNTIIIEILRQTFSTVSYSLCSRMRNSKLKQNHVYI